MSEYCPIGERYGYRAMCPECSRRRDNRRGGRVLWNLTMALDHMYCARRMHPHRGLRHWRLTDWCRRLVANGLTWDDIGAILGVSGRTARQHLREENKDEQQDRLDR
jgi:hypothetical protein